MSIQYNENSKYELKTTMKWTNESALLLAKGRNPQAVIEERVKSLIRDAMESGWEGPPYDPIALAKTLGIKVVPRADVDNARTIPSRGGYVIEYNPNRPRGRMRFSIAHEITHTLFPDCSEKVRNRSVHTNVGDEWQLELLCNVGAAELLMPTGEFDSLKGSLPPIEDLLELRTQYDVSMEAILIRAIRMSNTDAIMFAASVSLSGAIRIDYIKHSTFSDISLPKNFKAPSDSAIRDCSAIGYTCTSTERWGNKNLLIEAVGIPGFPGTIHPRVVGIARSTKQKIHQPLISYVRGSAATPRGEGRKFICHIVNDRAQSYGGGGFVAALKQEWADAGPAYREKLSHQPESLALGNVIPMVLSKDVTVMNLVAQKGYGPSKNPRIRYHALHQSLTRVAEFAVAQRATLHMPRLGAGQAGGRWPFIEEIIRQTISSKGISATIYDRPVQNAIEKASLQMELI